MKTISTGAWIGEGGHTFDRPLADGLCHVLTDLRVHSVIDIGCGDGSYTKHLDANGFACIGYDGNPVTPKVTNMLCGVADFSQVVYLGIFDAALSLEVGEHIPAEFEDQFIGNLVNHARQAIILSWAVVGQGGFGHVNERDNDYIIGRLADYRFEYDKKLSEYLRGKASICHWFRNTIMVFERQAYDMTPYRFGDEVRTPILRWD